MKRTITPRISWMLIFVLSATSFAQVMPKDPLGGLAAGTRVVVHKTDGSDWKGTLGSKTAAGFSLDAGRKGTIQISFTEVRSVEATRSGGGKAKWIVIGLVAAVAVVAGAIFAQRLHNEGAL